MSAVLDTRPSAHARLLELAHRDRLYCRFFVISNNNGDFDTAILVDPISQRCECASRRIEKNSRAAEAHEELSLQLMMNWYGKGL